MRSTPSRSLPLALGLLLITLLTATFLTHRDRREHWYALWDDGLHWRHAALNVAQQETARFFSIDYRHIDADVDDVLALASGTFKKEYAAKRASLRTMTQQGKVVWTAQVPSAGTALEYVDGDTAGVLVGVNVTKSVDWRTATPEYDRVRITLSYQGGRWLVSNFEDVG